MKTFLLNTLALVFIAMLALFASIVVHCFWFLVLLITWIKTA